MKFSGHETFPVREGWLHKGLKLLVESPELLVDQYAADYLGVGRNMAKSIRHWLVATNIASIETYKEGRIQTLGTTELGKLIWSKDPYFLEIATWWALHVNLATNQYSGSWCLFFNHFNLNRFEKSVCFEAQQRHINMSKIRMPSINTLDRDLTCLLASYSTQIPPKLQDPEDASNCPFQELGLIRHFKSSGYYELDRGVKNIPAHILGYALSIKYEEARIGEHTVDISFQEMAQAVGGPGRILTLTSESLFELAQKAEAELPSRNLYITGLAGERMLRVQRKNPLQWIEECYQITTESASHAS
ncbi:MAG: DUF4007 family protein [Nitrospina sp.]|jgi:hypothetical protein|nr:DUF4007 family protein [Nitrospina sp.]